MELSRSSATACRETPMVARLFRNQDLRAPRNFWAKSPEKLGDPMAFLDFLLKPKPSAPPVTIVDLEAKLSELHQERERSTSFLAGLETRRNQMLIDDRPPSEISKLDIDADAARIAIEKSEIFEAEILGRMAALHGAKAEAAWREAYDAMHMSAMSFAQKMSDCLNALCAFRAAAEELNNFPYGMRRPSAPPIILGNEALQNWLRDLESDDDFEQSRRARQG
jgi:hypothetical protein